MAPRTVGSALDISVYWIYGGVEPQHSKPLTRLLLWFYGAENGPVSPGHFSLLDPKPLPLPPNVGFDFEQSLGEPTALLLGGGCLGNEIRARC